MSETALSILVFLHLIFIAVWVGSQILVAAAVMPSLRRITGGEDRLAALEYFTRRFNHVAWGSMILIVITGGLMVSERIDQVKGADGSIFDTRWGWIFVIKMTLWVLMLGAVAAHSFLVGPRQLELNRQALEQDDSWAAQHLRPLQRRSIMLSVGGLVLSLLVLGSGAFLANHLYSFQAA